MITDVHDDNSGIDCPSLLVAAYADAHNAVAADDNNECRGDGPCGQLRFQ